MNGLQQTAGGVPKEPEEWRFPPGGLIICVMRFRKRQMSSSNLDDTVVPFNIG